MARDPNKFAELLDKVAVGSTDECWEWQAYRKPKGYGQTKFNGVTCKSARLAFMLFYGQMPDKLHVLHRCDNPPCCNPFHLWLGTNEENMKDRDAKGRGRWGKGKLVQEDATAIRQMIAEGQKLLAIARQFGVSRTVIKNIKCGKTWPGVA